MVMFICPSVHMFILLHRRIGLSQIWKGIPSVVLESLMLRSRVTEISMRCPKTGVRKIVETYLTNN